MKQSREDVSGMPAKAKKVAPKPIAVSPGKTVPAKSGKKAIKKAAKCAEKKPEVEKLPPGRPTLFTPEIAEKICAELSKGTPLTIICRGHDMPADRTVRDWMAGDETFSAAIADARARGFDQIAMDALAIADEVTEKDTIATDFGPIPNKEWLMRSKLRVETRLKLLSKWDPKRYGDKVTTEVSGPDGKPIKSETSHGIPDELQEAIITKTLAAAAVARNVEPPASFRGEERP